MKNTNKIKYFSAQPVRFSIIMLFASLLIIISATTSARTGKIIGPTPYFSAADSPFPLTEPRFFLEDFKDSTNSIGWTTDGNWLHCIPSNCIPDSVDSDDGTIDGNGSNGGSFCIGPSCFSALSVSFLFDPLILGGYPTNVGIVWTDGGFYTGNLQSGNFRLGNFQLQFDWYNSTGDLLDSVTISSPGDNNYEGQTGEDFFIGMEHLAGISRLRITGSGDLNYLELDHLQYGFRSTSSNTPLFSFPLSCGDKDCKFPFSQGAYTPKSITSVLDHQMDTPYKTDGVVTAFTDETGKGSATSLCYPKEDGSSFNVLGLYEGTSSDGCDAKKLNYDDHPGYDYKASLDTPVKAAASGTVVKILNTKTGEYGRCVPRGIDQDGCDAWGFVGIDHGNGYVTQYGHLNTVFVDSDDWVVEGQQIGLSGNKKPSSINRLINPHLHFEVLKKHDDEQYGYAFVDPYGWEGKPEEDYLAQKNGTENVRLWKYDPREVECLLNWAEFSYAHLLSPRGTSTQIFHPFSYRHYHNTNSFLGVSSIDNHVYYIGPDNALQNAGDLSDWLSVAGCQS